MKSGNGLDAVEFVEKDQPDVVVMDFRMPFMDGLQATKANYDHVAKC